MLRFNYDKLRGRIVEKLGKGSEKKFAEMLGKTQQTLSVIFNNKSVFSQTDIVLAAEILEIPPTEIASYFFVVEVQEAEQE